jgi:hypothetical protein
MLAQMFRTFPWAIAVLSAGVLASSPAVGGEWLSPCATAHLIASWKRDGFWRTAAVVDPPKHIEGNQVRYLGKVRAGGQAYHVYYDEGSNPESKQGHTDVIVASAKGRFIGLYAISDIELEPVGVRGADVLFNSSKAYGDRIHFGSNGPPERIYLNEEHYSFGKPDRSREPGPRLSEYCRR